MLEQVKMPSLGATMEEGTIIAWKVNEGDIIKAGDVLVELESDKTNYDFESPCSGVVRKIIANDGDTIPVEQLIAIIGDPDDHIPSDWLKEPQAVKTQLLPERQQAISEPKSTPQSVREQGVKISPKARKLAENLGIDISKITGTGPSGRIESSDIEKATQ